LDHCIRLDRGEAQQHGGDDHCGVAQAFDQRGDINYRGRGQYQVDDANPIRRDQLAGEPAGGENTGQDQQPTGQPA
jgi:hypothetical protein